MRVNKVFPACILLPFLIVCANAQQGAAVFEGLNVQPNLMVSFRGSICFIDAPGHNPALTCGDPDGSNVRTVFNLPQPFDALGQLIVLNNLMYFTLLKRNPDGQAHWDTNSYVSDGSTAGTHLLNGFATDFFSFRAEEHVIVGAKMFYLYNCTWHVPQLWVTDGSAAGSHLIRSFGNHSSTEFPFFTLFSGKILFGASDNNLPNKLWSIDPATNAVSLLADFKNTQNTTTGPDSFSTVNGKLYFEVTDVVKPNPNLAPRLWVTDGTSAGTHAVTANTSQSFQTAPAAITAIGNRLYYSAYDGSILSMRYTDGASVNIVKAFPHGGPGRYMDGGDGRVYFLASPDAANTSAPPSEAWWPVLWSTDGTTGGTIATAVAAQDAIALNGTILITDHFKTYAYTAGVRKPLPACDGINTFGNTFISGGNLYVPFFGADHQSHLCHITQ